ncbi:hypothetical protein I8752_18040 [Nostocaceae cyanobacterium CENA369]|uniref:Uncharacterized protein n=1 Tax=Dendronalium phyllosphericum CENA369 TaxID=1725256 RepID=A0A8J7LG88_9NOST|nr:hypothetical protein [Dendronalium phyllosphericum]MBH8574888.1 hypothetical protein [Dendronalium phyllosphericum CENA369]
MSSILRIKNIGTTIFKQTPVQSKDLKKSDPTYVARAGELFLASAIDRDVKKYGGDHWKVTFENKLQPREGGDPIQTWLVYEGDVEEYRLVK